jgi:hypothetical protein
MCAKSKTLSLVLLPALLLALLVLTSVPAGAVPKTRGECHGDHTTCLARCADKNVACKKYSGLGCEESRILCEDNCYQDWKDCLKDAGKTAPTVPKTKVQPKVKPGGAETPGTESPNVQPEGGIQRY